MTRDPRYDAAAATCQSRRGWHFPDESEPSSLQTVVGVLIKSLPALIVLGACVYLLWVF